MLTALLILVILLSMPHASAFSLNQTPAITIGERTSPSFGVLNPWGGLAFDASGDLWVADSENNRILEFAPPFSDNMNASTVIGQPNFQSTAASIGAGGLKFPEYMAFDNAGNLWVSDTDNNRLLEFPTPFHSGMNASVVIGQDSFSASFSNISRNGLSYPGQVVFDGSGNMWVADGGNGRALEYQPPFHTGMNASTVIGEPDFTHRYCAPPTYGYEASCSNHSILTGPEGIAFDPNGHLWVIEYGRLLEFKPPFQSGMDKTLLLQPVYSTGIAFDANGNLWLSCGYCYGGGGGSVVEYRPPLDAHRIVWENGNASNADFVLNGPWTGQPYNSSSFSSVLALPLGLTFDSAGNLWVVDARSSWLIGLLGRVVGYDAEIHPLDTQEGRVYFQNQGGLLVPLSALPIRQMDLINFPEGLFNFTIQGLNPGDSVKLKITFAQSLNPETEWLSKSSDRWLAFPANQTSMRGTT